MKIKNLISVLVSTFALSLFALSLFMSGHVLAKETQGVVVTIKPLHSLVSGVIGNTGTAELLLTGSTSPHGFQLKPSQVKNLQVAKVVFYINDSFETFLQGVFATLPANVRKAPVMQKARLAMLPQRKGGTWEAHAHDVHEHHEHEEAHYDEHKSHDEYDLTHDMHIWLDPENARRIVEYVAKELSAIYPENQSIYEANAQRYINKIKMLDAELKASLEGLQSKPFIVFHDAYQYFERAYGLTGIGSIMFDPDRSPSPNRIKEVRAKLQQTGAQCVFREPQFSDRLVKIVTEGTQAKSSTLDPLGANLKDGETLYFSLMRNLANDLKRCLT